MRLLIALYVFCLVCYVTCKTSNVKSLTESMGQEVIEIGAPIKGLNELPADLDEEPSAEEDDDDTTMTMTVTTTSTTTTPATKKTSPIKEARRKGGQDIDKIDDRNDEDLRIEKELAEIYKDNLDYKDDIPEVTSTTQKKTTTTPTTARTIHAVDAVDLEEKPIGRSNKMNFQFQPDSESKDAIERWRTSVDDISCNKAGTKKLLQESDITTRKVLTTTPGSASRTTINILLLLAAYYIL